MQNPNDSKTLQEDYQNFLEFKLFQEMMKQKNGNGKDSA